MSLKKILFYYVRRIRISNDNFFPGSVNESTSLFHYDIGYSHRDFSHPDFVPFFIDEFSEEKRNASIDACGGASASQACIFDFLATGDKALAESSGSEQATSESENAAAGEISFNYREMSIISNTKT